MKANVAEYNILQLECLNQNVCSWSEPGWDWSECPFQIKTAKWEGDGYPGSLE